MHIIVTTIFLVYFFSEKNYVSLGLCIVGLHCVLYGGAVRLCTLTGLFCIIPCTDSIVKVDLRVLSFDVPPQEVAISSRS